MISQLTAVGKRRIMPIRQPIAKARSFLKPISDYQFTLLTEAVYWHDRDKKSPLMPRPSLQPSMAGVVMLVN